MKLSSMEFSWSEGLLDAVPHGIRLVLRIESLVSGVDWMRRFSACLAAWLVCVACSLPVLGQRDPNPGPPPPRESRKPVPEYMAVVVLIALPIFVLCRSSRRSFGS